MKRSAIVVVAVGVGALALLVMFLGSRPAGQDDQDNQDNVAAFVGLTVEMYRSPGCSCCGEYVHYLSGHGLEVQEVATSDMTSVKESFGIPRNMWSCHTAIIGRYFVEGHVPIEAIQKLLEEQPDIDGIALPGMPAGSPGMGGGKTGPFVVYAVSDGAAREFTRE